MIKEEQILLSPTDFGRYMYKNETARVTGTSTDLLEGWLESPLLLQVSAVIFLPQPTHHNFFSHCTRT